MSKFSVRLCAIVVLSALGLAIAGLAMAAQRGPARGGAPAGGAAHFSAPAAHFARPSFSGAHSVGRPTSRSFSRPGFRGNIAHSYSRPVFHGAVRHPSNVTRTYARPIFRRNSSRVIAGHYELRDLHSNVTLSEHTIQSSRAIRAALNSRSVHDALRSPTALRNPTTRSLITMRTAAAGWHHGEHNFEHGWWRHRHGGFGWVGPIFWPFAYYDFYDYALWDGYDYSFWDYGYDDIYAGLFAPYGYDDLTGYLPEGANVSPRQRRHGGATSAPLGELAQMCGEDSRDIAGLPIDRIQQTLQTNDQQRAALEDLANASLKAARIIKAACPTDISLTAPGRLDVMEHRVEAMIQAVQIVEPALAEFYGLLTNEQKAKLTALGANQNGNNAATGSIAKSCAAPPVGVSDWPTDEIDRAVRPTDAQRAGLEALKSAGDRAADLLKASCPNEEPLTPPARLAAVAKRLDAMLQAIKTVRTELNGFYNSLSDEQKAQFDAIGPQRAARG